MSVIVITKTTRDGAMSVRQRQVVRQQENAVGPGRPCGNGIERSHRNPLPPPMSLVEFSLSFPLLLLNIYILKQFCLQPRSQQQNFFSVFYIILFFSSVLFAHCVCNQKTNLSDFNVITKEQFNSLFDRTLLRFDNVVIKTILFLHKLFYIISLT